MYPSPDQEPSNNAPLAQDYAQPYVYNAAAQAEQNAYQQLNIERRGLMVELLAYPWQSMRSFYQPGLSTFAKATLSARWGVVWISLFTLPLLGSLIALFLGGTGRHITSGTLAAILLSPLIVIPILFLSYRV